MRSLFIFTLIFFRLLFCFYGKKQMAFFIFCMNDFFFVFDCDETVEKKHFNLAEVFRHLLSHALFRNTFDDGNNILV